MVYLEGRRRGVLLEYICKSVPLSVTQSYYIYVCEEYSSVLLLGASTTPVSAVPFQHLKIKNHGNFLPNPQNKHRPPAE